MFRPVSSPSTPAPNSSFSSGTSSSSAAFLSASVRMSINLSSSRSSIILMLTSSSISISSSISPSPADSFSSGSASLLAIAGVSVLTTALTICARKETLCSPLVVRDLKSVSRTGTIFLSNSSSTLIPVDLLGVGSTSGTPPSSNIFSSSRVANLNILFSNKSFSLAFFCLTIRIKSLILDLSVLSSWFILKCLFL